MAGGARLTMHGNAPLKGLVESPALFPNPEPVRVRSELEGVVVAAVGGLLHVLRGHYKVSPVLAAPLGLCLKGYENRKYGTGIGATLWNLRG